MLRRLARRRRLVVLLLAPALSWASLRWAVSTAEMTSGSMSPCLEGDECGGDVVLVDRLAYRFREPRRGEVVAFESADGIPIMKRVAGLPGESVSLDPEGEILVDGRPHGEPALAGRAYRPDGFLRNGPVPTRAGEYFVLGDFTSDSWDSRYWGGLERSRIHGRAVWILWPPGRFGPVE